MGSSVHTKVHWVCYTLIALFHQLSTTNILISKHATFYCIFFSCTFTTFSAMIGHNLLKVSTVKLLQIFIIAIVQIFAVSRSLILLQKYPTVGLNYR